MPVITKFIKPNVYVIELVEDVLRTKKGDLLFILTEGTFRGNIYISMHKVWNIKRSVFHYFSLTRAAWADVSSPYHVDWLSRGLMDLDHSSYAMDWELYVKVLTDLTSLQKV